MARRSSYQQPALPPIPAVLGEGFASRRSPEQALAELRIFCTPCPAADCTGVLGGMYDWGESLGAGAFGVTRVVTERCSGLRFACKTVTKDKGGGTVRTAHTHRRV